jgi:Predicted methyltransferases
LEQVRDVESTLVFYETPHRILEALGDIDAVLGPRPVVLTREMTKLHEEFLRGPALEIQTQLAGRPSVKGEITLVIGKAEAPIYDAALTLPEAVKGHIGMGLSRMDAIKAVARERGLSKREVYAAVESE